MATMDPALIPAGPPPLGVQSNFVDPPNNIAGAIAGAVVTIVATLPFIFTRVFVNINTRIVRPEDILSYLAWGCFLTQVSLILVNSSNGTARHTWDVNLEILIPGSRMYNIIFIFYTLSGGFAKACVFLQFKRIFTTALRGTVYWVIVISLAINAVAYTCFFFLYLFTCWPREKIWNSTVPGHCMDSNKLNMAIGALNTISDVEAFLVPAWAIWQLRMKLKKKLEVFAVFAVGALAVAIGCVGMYYRVLVLRGPDVTWLLTQTGIICMGELAVVIIVGCCPYIPRVFRLARGKASAYYNSSYTHDQSMSMSKPATHLDPFGKAAPGNDAQSSLDEPLELYDCRGNPYSNLGPDFRPDDLPDLPWLGSEGGVRTTEASTQPHSPKIV